MRKPKRVSGTKFVYGAGNPPAERLIPFTFSTTENFIIALNKEFLRIYRSSDGEIVEEFKLD